MNGKSLFALLMVLGSIGVFFGYIEPTYTEVNALEERNQRLDDALTKARELQAERDSLLSRFNTFNPDDVDRLRKMVPDNVDNVRLILDMDTIASNYDVNLSGFAISEDGGQTPDRVRASGEVERSNALYRSLVLSFSAVASYDNMLLFLRDLERSLRLVDIESISFQSNGPGTASAPYTFSISIRTYWLQ